MRSIVLALGLCLVASCGPDDGLLDPIETGETCNVDIALAASTAERSAADGSIEVFGTSSAPDGVTVRSLYAGGVAVPLTDFNYRSWSVSIPADQVAAQTRNGLATLAVVAYTSKGCAQLTPPLTVHVSEGEGGAGGQAGEGGTAGAGGNAGQAGESGGGGAAGTSGDAGFANSGGGTGGVSNPGGGGTGGVSNPGGSGSGG